MRPIFYAFLLFISCVANVIANPIYQEPITSTVSVLFSKGSNSFHPDLVTTKILRSAKSASMIIVSGRTSTLLHPKYDDESLALKRALSARSYLVAHGVSPLKIMINYAAAADYAAKNDTVEGQRLNQRVDIQLFYVPVH